MENCKSYVGIDVSKSYLDLQIADSQIYRRYPNNSDGIHKLMDTIRGIGGEITLLCEATGGYEKLLVQVSNNQEFKIIVIQPRQIRSFAKALNIHCKTDKIDANVLALFCKHFGHKLYAHKTYPLQEELRFLMRRRNELVERKVEIGNRIEKLLKTDRILASYEEEKAFVEKLIKNIDKDLKEYIKSNDTLKNQHELLQSIQGIGFKTAVEIIAELPEITELSPSQLAALVGLAPINKDSGRYQGKRFIQGGRKQVRKALYMAAVTAIKYDSTLKEFYQRLLTKGKPFKVAITAVCRKMILMAQVVLKRQTPWTAHVSA